MFGGSFLKASRTLRPEFREIQNELPALALLSTALWSDGGHGERVTLESMTAVLMLDLSSSRMVEKLSTVLLSRAQKDGVAPNAESLGNQFFRLDPEERLVLISLHRGKWSYDRISKILGVTAEKVQELAWAARLHLIYSPESASILAQQGGYSKLVPQGLIHPTGSLFNGVRCPEYHPGRPWTQRFLDQESTTREKHFLETHLKGCDQCRKALSRARTLYYSAERLLPEVPKNSPTARERLEAMAQTLVRAARFKHPIDRSFGETMEIFVQRPEIQLAISALVVLVAFHFLRK